MAITLQSFGTMVSGMAATVQGAASSLIDLTVGSVVRATLESTASIALWLQYIALSILTRTRLATSQGADVDSWVGDFGVARLPATYATGAVTLISLNPTSQAATVPVGATVRTASGISFAITADTTNTAYSVSANGYIRPLGTASITVPVQAVTAGSAADVPAGAINLLGTAISGIDTCNNALAFTDANDGETDAALRTRFVAFINTRSQGTELAIGYAVASVQAGLVYQIVENADPTGAFLPGNVTIFVDDGSGSPPQSLLSTVYAAVDLVRPVSISIYVVGPTVLTATVGMSVQAATGYTAAAVDAAVTTALATFINSAAMGVNLSYTRLISVVYGVPGVANVLNVTLNGAAADLTVATGQVVRAGVITVVPA